MSNSDSVNLTENSIADSSIGSLPTLGTSSSSVLNFSPIHNNNESSNFSNSGFSNSENSPIIINPFSIPEIENEEVIRAFLLDQTVGDIFLDDEELTPENYYQYGYLKGYNDCTINSNLNISNGSISSNSTIESQGPMNIDELVVPQGVEGLNQLNNSISTMGNTTRSSNADTFSFDGTNTSLGLGGKKKGKKKTIKKNNTKKKKGKLRRKRVTKRKV